MNEAMRSPARERRAGAAGRLPLLLVVLALAAPAAGAAAPGADDPRRGDGGSAEVRFPAPVHHAIVLQPPGPVRTLYGPGDVIVWRRHDQDRQLSARQASTASRSRPSPLAVRQTGAWARQI